MKFRILLALCYLGSLSSINAQVEQSDPDVFIGNGVGNHIDETADLQTQILIGDPILSLSTETSTFLNRVGFPFGVLYVPSTFSDDTFVVSKGYYGNRVALRWQVGANEDVIQRFKLLRKKLEDDDTAYIEIATLSSDTYSYDDINVEANVLYEYRLEAEGVSAFPERLITYIDGVGFRNPTAVVSGTITFEGGSPVENVLVYANNQGGNTATNGRSYDANLGYLQANNIKNLEEVSELSFQSWIRINDTSGDSNLISLIDDSQNALLLRAHKTADNSQLRFSINSNTVVIRNFLPTGEIDGQGRDVFKSISEVLSEEFIHISVILSMGNTPVFLY